MRTFSYVLAVVVVLVALLVIVAAIAAGGFGPFELVLALVPFALAVLTYKSARGRPLGPSLAGAVGRQSTARSWNPGDPAQPAKSCFDRVLVQARLLLLPVRARGAPPR